MYIVCEAHIEALVFVKYTLLQYVKKWLLKNEYVITRIIVIIFVIIYCTLFYVFQ